MVSEKIRKLLDTLRPSSAVQVTGEGKEQVVLLSKDGKTPAKVTGHDLKVKPAKSKDLPEGDEEGNEHEVDVTSVTIDFSWWGKAVTYSSALALGVNALVATIDTVVRWLS